MGSSRRRHWPVHPVHRPSSSSTSTTSAPGRSLSCPLAVRSNNPPCSLCPHPPSPPPHHRHASSLSPSPGHHHDPDHCSRPSLLTTDRSQTICGERVKWTSFNDVHHHDRHQDKGVWEESTRCNDSFGSFDDQPSSSWLCHTPDDHDGPLSSMMMVTSTLFVPSSPSSSLLSEPLQCPKYRGPTLTATTTCAPVHQFCDVNRRRRRCGAHPFSLINTILVAVLAIHILPTLPFSSFTAVQAQIQSGGMLFWFGASMRVSCWNLTGVLMKFSRDLSGSLM